MTKTYVVAGAEHTGTSAMTLAISQGANVPIYQNTYHADKDNAPYPSYEWQGPVVPQDVAGKVIKRFYDSVLTTLPGISAEDIYIVYMLREPQARAIAHGDAITDAGVARYYRAQLAIITSLQHIYPHIETVWFDHLIDDPRAVFTRLRARGWELDHILRATRVINRSMRHAHGYNPWRQF